MFKPYSEYHAAVKYEMESLAKDPKTIFIGQQCVSEDFYSTLTNVPKEKKYEMPVAEELQLGISIGLAIQGFLPISIFQRMDFLPRAFDQLVNHLNVFSELTQNIYKPKIIIRTTIGQENTGIQHNKDLTNLLKIACDFPVITMETTQQVHSAYDLAKKIDTSILLIERQNLYYGN